MTAHTRHHAGTHAHNHDHGNGLAELLDLDARVLGSYLDAATQWASGLAPAAKAIVDVGSGPGAGTVALADRFPGAEVVAVDRSGEMLTRTLEAARSQGLAGWVRVVEADLDGAWPALGPADLIWASSSLHELADPDRALREMFATLRPGGLLVVVEMDALPRFLPDGFNDGLESRLHSALAQQGWNSHPDWRPGLERAGFPAVEQRSFPTASHPTPGLAARYARAFLGRMGPALEGVAGAADVEALQALLADTSPGALLHSPDLEVRGRRTAWAARRP